MLLFSSKLTQKTNGILKHCFAEHHIEVTIDVKLYFYTVANCPSKWLVFWSTCCKEFKRIFDKIFLAYFRSFDQC